MNASPAKLRDGSWGVRVKGAAKPGDVVQVVAANGKRWTATVARVIWQGDGVSLCATEARGGQRAGGGGRRSSRECPRCGCTDCGGPCRGPSFDPCFDCV